jgi:hypothetical protein
MSVNVSPQTVGPVTLFMTEMFSDLDMTGVPVGFQSFFGRDGIGRTDFVNNSLQISIDIVRGESTISKMLTRQTGASWDLGDQTNSVKGQRFLNRTRVFPLMTEPMHVGFDDLFNRVAGEVQQFSSGSEDTGVLMNRLRIRFAEQMKNAIKKLMRRNELACAESIRVGTQTLDDGGGSYSWDRSTTNSFAAALVWTNANATIIEEIDDLCDELQQNGKKEPTFGLPGVDVWGAMVKQLTMQNLADNRGYTFIRAGQANAQLPELDSSVAWMVEAGFKHVGFVETFKGRKLPMFIYNEKYQDAAKAWQPYMPVDEFVAGFSGARCDRAFGPRITFPNNPFHDQAMNALLGFDFTSAPMPENLANPGVFDARMFHIDGKVNADNDAIAARMVTGGIFPTTETDVFGRITGVV